MSMDAEIAKKREEDRLQRERLEGEKRREDVQAAILIELSRTAGVAALFILVYLAIRKGYYMTRDHYRTLTDEAVDLARISLTYERISELGQVASEVLKDGQLNNIDQQLLVINVLQTIDGEFGSVYGEFSNFKRAFVENNDENNDENNIFSSFGSNLMHISKKLEELSKTLNSETQPSQDFKQSAIKNLQSFIEKLQNSKLQNSELQNSELQNNNNEESLIKSLIESLIGDDNTSGNNTDIGTELVKGIQSLVSDVKDNRSVLDVLKALEDKVSNHAYQVWIKKPRTKHLVSELDFLIDLKKQIVSNTKIVSNTFDDKKLRSYFNERFDELLKDFKENPENLDAIKSNLTQFINLFKEFSKVLNGANKDYVVGFIEEFEPLLEGDKKEIKDAFNALKNEKDNLITNIISDLSKNTNGSSIELIDAICKERCREIENDFSQLFLEFSGKYKSFWVGLKVLLDQVVSQTDYLFQENTELLQLYKALSKDELDESTIGGFTAQKASELVLRALHHFQIPGQLPNVDVTKELGLNASVQDIVALSTARVLKGPQHEFYQKFSRLTLKPNLTPKTPAEPNQESTSQPQDRFLKILRDHARLQAELQRYAERPRFSGIASVIDDNDKRLRLVDRAMKKQFEASFEKLKEDMINLYNECDNLPIEWCPRELVDLTKIKGPIDFKKPPINLYDVELVFSNIAMNNLLKDIHELDEYKNNPEAYEEVRKALMYESSIYDQVINEQTQNQPNAPNATTKVVNLLEELQNKLSLEHGGKHKAFIQAQIESLKSAKTSLLASFARNSTLGRELMKNRVMELKKFYEDHINTGAYRLFNGSLVNGEFLDRMSVENQLVYLTTVIYAVQTRQPDLVNDLNEKIRELCKGRNDYHLIQHPEMQEILQNYAIRSKQNQTSKRAKI